MVVIILWILGCDLILGTAMMLYLSLEWEYSKWKIMRNGWTLSRCNPVWPLWQNLFLYIPVAGFLWYLYAGTLVHELSITKKEEDTVVAVSVFGLTAMYCE